MSDKAIEIGDFWITKKNPIECEVTGLSLKREVPIITSYSAQDGCTDTCTQFEFLRDYEFLRKGSESESDKDWVCSGCDKPVSDCLCLLDGENFEVDMVNEPPHYKDASGIECIEVTKHMQFCGGSCFMHLYEADSKKNTIEDLKKAKWYAERAWIGNEQVSDEVYHLIADIAHHSRLGVSDVMMEIARSDWYAAGWRINDEIARLESE